MVARPEGLSTVSETPDDKIELLVRSVLTAVDMRLGEVRHEMHAVAAESEQRHRQVLQYMRDLEHRLERRSDDASPLSGTGDSLAQRMEEATQAMLERIDELHQRNTVATNERFALINNTLEQLGGIASASSTGSISPPSMMLSLDAMDAPLRVGPITAQQPAVADAADIPLDISPAFAAPAVVAAESTMQHDDGAHDEVVHEKPSTRKPSVRSQSGLTRRETRTRRRKRSSERQSPVRRSTWIASPTCSVSGWST